MLHSIVTVVLHMMAGVVAAAVLCLGFAFLIFLGDAEARGRPLFSRGLDRFGALLVYASWFALLWWFGFSTALLMVACAATTVLCLVYVASYRKSASRRPPAPLAGA
jgi:hypothetical protein